MVSHGVSKMDGLSLARPILAGSAYRLMALASVIVALVSIRFVLVGIDQAFGNSEPFQVLLNQAPALFIAHIIAGPTALIIGWVQFVARIRNRWPGFHRGLGRIYFLAAMIGGTTGFALALTMLETRPIAGAGFALLSLGWLGTSILGVQAARKRRFFVHRRWMIYSFALAFSAVTLRLQLFIALAFGFDYEAASVVLAWSCWIPNLIFAGWYLRMIPKAPRQSLNILPPSAVSVALKGQPS